MMPHDLIATLDERRAKYAENWTSGNAAGFEAAGDYRWMADQISGHQYILDVGIGDGRPAVELLSRGHDIVSVDENIACVMLAGNRLRAAGYNAHIIEREIERRQLDDCYEIGYAEVGDARRPPHGEPVVVEGDILTDDGLVDALRTIAPFDAVTCWLIGTHEAVRFNRYFRHVETDHAAYRGHVHVRICEIADSVLRSGGVLHIVDRALESAERFESEFRHDYAQLASGTSLVLESLSFRPYEEGEHGIEMRIGAGRGRAVEGRMRTLVSVLLRRS